MAENVVEPMTEERLAFHRATADKYPTSNVAECVKEIDRLRAELGYVVFDRYGLIELDATRNVVGFATTHGGVKSFSVDPPSVRVAAPGSGDGPTAEQRVAAYWAEQRDKPSPYGEVVGHSDLTPFQQMVVDGFTKGYHAREVVAGMVADKVKKIVGPDIPVKVTLASLIPTDAERCPDCRHPICEGGCQVGACSNGDHPIKIDQEGRPCS